MSEDGPRTRVCPSHESARECIEHAIADDSLVTVFGRCRVDYDGRATSTLESGDRLVVLKPDGTVLVHTDEGQQPVNWQPPGCTHEVGLDDERLVVSSYRERPAETLEIAFQHVDHVTAYDITDEEDLSLHGTEADLRERVLDEPSLVEPGFEPRATERETEAGAVDIFGEDSDGNAVVVELKRRRVGPDAVSQLNRYVETLHRELHTGTDVRGILVAPSVTDRADQLLDRRGLEFVALSPTPDS